MTDEEFAAYLKSTRGKRLTEPNSLDGLVDAELHKARQAAQESLEREILFGKESP